MFVANDARLFRQLLWVIYRWVRLLWLLIDTICLGLVVSPLVSIETVRRSSLMGMAMAGPSPWVIILLRLVGIDLLLGWILGERWYANPGAKRFTTWNIRCRNKRWVMRLGRHIS